MDNLKLIYDLKSIPEGINIDQLYNIMVSGSIVVWDSSNGGEEPQILTSDITAYDVAFIPKEMLDEKLEGLLE